MKLSLTVSVPSKSNATTAGAWGLPPPPAISSGIGWSCDMSAKSHVWWRKRPGSGRRAANCRDEAARLVIPGGIDECQDLDNPRHVFCIDGLQRPLRRNG